MAEFIHYNIDHKVILDSGLLGVKALVEKYHCDYELVFNFLRPYMRYLYSDLPFEVSKVFYNTPKELVDTSDRIIPESSLEEEISGFIQCEGLTYVCILISQ